MAIRVPWVVLTLGSLILTGAGSSAAAQPAGGSAPGAAMPPAPGSGAPPSVPSATPGTDAPPPPEIATDPRVQYTLDAQGNWVAISAPVAGSDGAILADAGRFIAAEKPEQARALLDAWIAGNGRGQSPYLPAAYLMRGDAISASGDEYAALYDYEFVIRQFPAAPEFVKANERELEIATAYVRGLDRKWLGIRWVSATDVGIELLIRIQERMPGSRLGEQAGIELADYYYRNRELALAATSYELFLKNYPNSAYRNKALQRQVYSNIGRYKGPQYDGSALLDSRVLIRRYMALYPASAEEAGLDEALLARIDESAGQHMLETARWYLIRNDPVSARFHLRRLLRDHPQSAAAAEGLRLMQEKGWMNLQPLRPEGTREMDEITTTPTPDAAPAAEAAPSSPATQPSGGAQ